eukprot:IDg17629t1
MTALNAFRKHSLHRLYKHLQTDAAKSITLKKIAAAFGDDKSNDARAAGTISADEFVAALADTPSSNAPIEDFDRATRAVTPIEVLPPYRMWFDLTPDALSALTKDLMESRRATLDAVASTRPPTAASTVLAVAQSDAALSSIESMIDFPQHVSTCKKLRDASAKATTELSAFEVEQSMRVDVYKAIEEFAKSAEAATLVGEEKRMLERMLREARRNGLQLDSDKRG